MHGRRLDRPQPTACQAKAPTPHTRAMAMRAHTLAIVVIEAVFQAPMFALKAVAPLNACEPNHAPSPHEPEGRLGECRAWV
jgi:hypothetical protein